MQITMEATIKVKVWRTVEVDSIADVKLAVDTFETDFSREGYIEFPHKHHCGDDYIEYMPESIIYETEIYDGTLPNYIGNLDQYIDYVDARLLHELHFTDRN